MADKNKGPEMKKGTFSRLMKYIFAHYSWKIMIVLFCIVISAISTVVATVFLQRLIDEVITPGITSGFDAVRDQFMMIISLMILIHTAGVIGSFTYTRIMAGVTQGILKHFRTDMFNKMEMLPIKYLIRMRMAIL